MPLQNKTVCHILPFCVQFIKLFKAGYIACCFILFNNQTKGASHLEIWLSSVVLLILPVGRLIAIAERFACTDSRARLIEVNNGTQIKIIR